MNKIKVITPILVGLCFAFIPKIFVGKDYEILEEESLPHVWKVVKIITGKDGVKPKDDWMLGVGEEIIDKNRDVNVSVMFYLPGMSKRGQPYASVDKDHDSKLRIYGNEPKEFCRGDKVFWFLALAMCVHAHTENDYLEGLKDNERFGSIVSDEAQAEFELGSAIAKAKLTEDWKQQRLVHYEAAAKKGHYYAASAISAEFHSLVAENKEDQDLKKYAKSWNEIALALRKDTEDAGYKIFP